MIKDEHGDKCTPKELAQEILMRDMEKAFNRWVYDNEERLEAMTDREADLVTDQLLKQFKRVGKLMGWRVVTEEEAEAEDAAEAAEEAASA